jgi:hypothetical protein
LVLALSVENIQMKQGAGLPGVDEAIAAFDTAIEAF